MHITKLPECLALLIYDWKLSVSSIGLALTYLPWVFSLFSSVPSR